MKNLKKIVVGTLLASLFGNAVPLARADRYDPGDRRGTYDRDRDRDGDRDRRRDEWRGRRADWDKVGTVAVGRDLSRDVIEVSGRTRYNAIMFRVDQGDMVLEDLKITFADDSVYSPNLKLTFREGERSQIIDMPSDARRVKRIRFLYRSAHRSSPAVVDVYGMR